MNNQITISLIEKFQSLNLSAFIHFDKFNGYAITHHSTTIEGSTLTETETRLLLDEGITPAGKPLLHSLMVQDHYNALLFITQKVKDKIALTPEFILQINAAVMKQTGSIYQTVFCPPVLFLKKTKWLILKHWNKQEMKKTSASSEHL